MSRHDTLPPGIRFLKSRKHAPYRVDLISSAGTVERHYFSNLVDALDHSIFFRRQHHAEAIQALEEARAEYFLKFKDA